MSRPNRIYNLNEYHKRELYAQDSADNSQAQYGVNTIGISNATTEIPVSQQIIGFRDWEMLFDSVFTKIPSNLINGQIIFNISDVNNGQGLGSVVEMNLGSFFFPIPIQSAASPNFYFYRRVYLQIAELPTTQSSRAPNGNRYQFEFNVDNLNSVAVLLTPIKDSFFLQLPITSLNQVTFNFSVGPYFTPIPLPLSNVQIYGIPGTTPATFTLLNNVNTNIIGPVGVPTAPGVAVFVTGFAPNVPITTTQGVYVTNIVDASTLQIAGYTIASGIAAPGVAPTTVAGVPVGALTPATVYNYVVTFLTTGAGETSASPASIGLVTPGSGSISITSVPTSASTNVIARNIYRNKFGDANHYLVTSVAGNLPLVAPILDGASDASLGVIVPTSNTSQAPNTSYLATMVIGKNRISIPLRFTTVENKVTNYISVTHS